MIAFEFEGEQRYEVPSPLERNNVIGVLSTGLEKSLILQFFVIAAEIKSRTS